MQNVKDASVEWIQTHIVDLWPAEQQPGEVAEALAAIADLENVPVEQVIAWLHDVHASGHEPSPLLFLRSRDGKAR